MSDDDVELDDPDAAELAPWCYKCKHAPCTCDADYEAFIERQHERQQP